MRPASHCATRVVVVLASMITLVATAEAEGRYQRPVDRSTSTPPDLRFPWRMVKERGLVCGLCAPGDRPKTNLLRRVGNPPTTSIAQTGRKDWG